MGRKWLVSLTVFWLILTVGLSLAEDYPTGGMVPRDVPVTTEEPIAAEQDLSGNIGILLRKALTATPMISGPKECVTGKTYTWTLSDRTSSADTNLYELQMAVQDGTYENPNMADIMYKSARSRETELEYTFYIPGNYVIFMDVYASETAKEPLKTVYLAVAVTDGGENELTRKVQEVAARYSALNEAEKAIELHDWILDNCEYDRSHTWYSADSLLLHGTGVCNSYTRAFALLLEEAGIECRRVSGYVNGDSKAGHAWNAVKLDGDWYLFDCTWDDQTSQFAKHSYCGVTDELLEIEHTAEHYAGAATRPECSSLADNWFVLNDRWRNFAETMYTEYTNLLETGWHRFSLTAPKVPLNNPSKYHQVMLGTVTAYAMSNTTWTYGEGKECTGEFSYDYDEKKISGKHTMNGVLELPEGLKHIEAGSFENSAANKVVIGANCEYIGSGAFAGMDLWELEVRANQMMIDGDPFEGIDFVYVIAATDSSIANFARDPQRGWAVEEKGANTD